MFKKISARSIASIIFVTLLLISILYFPIRNLYPKYDVYFMIFGQFVGSILLTLAIIFIIALVILIIKRFLIKPAK